MDKSTKTIIRLFFDEGLFHSFDDADEILQENFPINKRRRKEAEIYKKQCQ